MPRKRGVKSKVKPKKEEKSSNLLPKKRRYQITEMLMSGMIFHPDKSGPQFVQKLAARASALGISDEDFERWNQELYNEYKEETQRRVDKMMDLLRNNKKPK